MARDNLSKYVVYSLHRKITAQNISFLPIFTSLFEKSTLFACNALKLWRTQAKYINEANYLLYSYTAGSGEDGSEIGACDDTVNPVSGFIYAENEEQAVNYGIDFIMKYAGDNLLLEDNSILLLDDNRPMDLYYDFSAVEVG